jgi:nitroreductase
VAGAAPSTKELLPLVSLAATTADHASLRPWRLIELRGEARSRLGAAFLEASAADSPAGFSLDPAAAERLAAKPLRAPLLIALVACRRESFKVPDWEQDAAAAGVAHILSLLLDDAGWGVMWRTGGHTRSDAVRRFHKLADNEQLLGWLYVGSRVEADADRTGADRTSTDRTGAVKPRSEFRPGDFLSSL